VKRRDMLALAASIGAAPYVIRQAQIPAIQFL